MEMHLVGQFHLPVVIINYSCQFIIGMQPRHSNIKLEVQSEVFSVGTPRVSTCLAAYFKQQLLPFPPIND